jgi:cytochrome c nitrite reductase small subunit
MRHLPLTLVLAILVGLAFGIGLFTFAYARGGAYLTDDPAACSNCHVMLEQYAGWLKASHRRAAVCNDCHTPDGFLAKYTTKAVNGFFHSWAFTTGRFPDRIRITARNGRVTRESCLKCHAAITETIRAGRPNGADLLCIECHRDVGHAHD